MATRQEPLDEQACSKPEVIEWWMSGQHGVGSPPYTFMDERMIHRYFSELPFFDWTTTNGLWLEQSKTDIRLWNLVHNRQEFERELSKRPGKEYVITGSPKQLQIPGQPAEVTESSGVWNIRKQNRERRDGTETLETLGTFYAVGATFYQAPSVADVVGNRLLSATASLNKYMELATVLPEFSPTTGHTYLPHSNKPTTVASTQATPNGSRQGSVGPGIAVQSLQSGNIAPERKAVNNLSAEDTRQARLLAQSFSDAIQYTDEYMDENPILGQPGSFSFTSSSAAVKKRKAEEEAANQKSATAAKAQVERSSSRTASPKPEKAPSPPPVFSEAKAGVKTDKDRRGSKTTDKAKRKKSKPNLQSPTTPVSTTSTVPPTYAG